ncbi:MAG: DUF488 domain-containing protein [Dehalococcoidales bacterium]|nr:DUF488 domain-containing protein [Dehalococcoidales bacterium]
MTIYTIGFSKKSAEEFFEALRGSGAKHLLDIRLHNKSQLTGFTKRNDLPYFLKHLVNMEYHEVPILAPEESILKEYHKTGDWARYEQRYLELIRQRRAEKHIGSVLFEEGIVLLCSEAEPTHCHRRLAAEYLAQAMLTNAKAKIVHL